MMPTVKKHYFFVASTLQGSAPPDTDDAMDGDAPGGNGDTQQESQSGGWMECRRQDNANCDPPTSAAVHDQWQAPSGDGGIVLRWQLNLIELVEMVLFWALLVLQSGYVYAMVFLP